MTTNRLPKYWVVKNDESKEFYSEVISYINEQVWYQQFEWSAYGAYYGFHWIWNCENDIEYLKNNPTLLTVAEFIELTTAEPEPVRGDKVLVWDHNEEEYEPAQRTFLGMIEWARYPYFCVSAWEEEEFNKWQEFSAQPWRFCKKVPAEVVVEPVSLSWKECKVTIDWVEYDAIIK